ncbi:MAG: BMP family ABC transporter substrate-binding protein, partial [Firmicutes bacterium]|nr:BMP family ABC transporter substrate-binding protein [Bacillota bacterium]
MPKKSLGVMEIPVELIAGTKTRARQNAFSAGFMPLMEPETEFAYKWASLYSTQIGEGFSDPIKVYEYLQRFYVYEGNKRVSVSRFLEMPVISAEVTRVMPAAYVLAQNPEYAEFLSFFAVTGIYDIGFSRKGAFAEMADLLGKDLKKRWNEDEIRSLKRTYWMFSQAYADLRSKGAD